MDSSTSTTIGSSPTPPTVFQKNSAWACGSSSARKK